MHILGIDVDSDMPSVTSVAGARWGLCTAGSGIWDAEAGCDARGPWRGSLA